MTKVIFPPAIDLFSDGSWGKGDCGHSIRVDWDYCPICGSPVEEKIMIEDKRPTLIAVCGKSASGKDYFVKKVCKHYGDKINKIVPDTTRPNRINEKDSVDYNFITTPVFVKKHRQGKYLESSCYNGWHYGISVDQIVCDKINIGVFDKQGLEALVKNKDNYNIILVYLKCSFSKRIFRYIKREKKISREMFRRFAADQKDFFIMEEEISYYYKKNFKEVHILKND